MKEEKRKKRLAKAMEKRLRKVQRHHITYKPEKVVVVFQGEHWLLSQLQRRRYVSDGFLQAVEHELSRMKKGKVYQLKSRKRSKRRKRKRVSR